MLSRDHPAPLAVAYARHGHQPGGRIGASCLLSSRPHDDLSVTLTRVRRLGPHYDCPPRVATTCSAGRRTLEDRPT